MPSLARFLTALLALAGLLLGLAAHAGPPPPPSADAVLAAMLSLPQYTGDRIVDPPAERARLYRPVAEAIAQVARSRADAAALIALGYAETAFARYVLDGHCYQGPAGARCDGGRARGAWQVWSWCRALWAGPENAPDRHVAGARCALQRLRAGRTACPAQGYAGMLSHYGRGHCTWGPAKARAATMALVEGRLRAYRAPPPD